MYALEVKKGLDKKFIKLAKKDKKQMEIIDKKIMQIRQNPYAFKPLKSPLQNHRRVHIMKSFVLIYSVNEKEKTVVLEDYEHHDKIYK